MTRTKRVVPSVAGLDAQTLLLSFFVSIGATAGAIMPDPPPAVTLDCPGLYATGAVPNARREPAERPASPSSGTPIYEVVNSEHNR